MSEEKDVYKTTIRLDGKYAEWLENKGRRFNFSQFVRDAIDEELEED